MSDVSYVSNHCEETKSQLRTVSIKYTTFEEKGEPKRNPTHVDDEAELHVHGCRLTY